jgi:4-amino-4-deoxy-L-arabinose transferase-like glycosyltransferase
MLAAFILRLVFAFVLSPWLFPDRELGSSGGYDDIAKSLLQGKGFVYSDGQVEMFRPPVYVMFIAAHYFLFGVHNSVIVISHILLSMISIFLLWKITLLLTGDEITARAAAFLYSIYPFAIWRIPVILADALFIPILLLCIFLVSKYLKEDISKNKSLLAAVVGLVLAGLTLTKPVASLYSFCIVLTMFIGRKNGWKSIVLNVFIMLSVYTVIIIPWTMRNYALTGEWPVVASGAGFILSNGVTYAENFSISDMSSEKYDDLSGVRLDSIANERGWSMHESAEPLSYHDDLLLRNEILGNMLKMPGKAITIYLKNLAFFWFLAKSQTKSIFYLLIQLPLLILSISGIIRFRKQITLPIFFIIFSAIYFWGASSVFLGAVRYSDPVIPLIMVLLVLQTSNWKEYPKIYRYQRRQPDSVIGG